MYKLNRPNIELKITATFFVVLLILTPAFVGAFQDLDIYKFGMALIKKNLNY